MTFPSLPAGTPLGVGRGTFQSRDLHLPTGSLPGPLHRRPDRDAAGRAVCTAVIGSIVGDAPAEDDIALLMARIQT
ncbi:hypothetical protein ABZ907_47555 [Nonomuraea wenchangensis]